MPLITLPSPKGIIPRTDPRLLPNDHAEIAENCNLRAGNLRALRQPLKVAELDHAGTIRTLFRARKGEAAAWLAWAAEVSVCRSPIQGDELARVYFTGDGEPRVTSYDLATVGAGTAYPLASYALGLPEPVTAPTLTPAGGSGAVTLAYCYTFYSAWGEESGRSPAAVVTANSGGTVTVSAMDAGPANSGTVSGATHAGGYVTVTTAAAHWLRPGHRVTLASVGGMTELNGTWTVYDTPAATTFRVKLTATNAYTSGGSWARGAAWNTTGLKLRIYRTVTTSSGTIYYRVGEVASGASFVDSVSSPALIEALPDSVARAALPPGDLKGLALLPGGVLAGVTEANELCFSEPNQPHSWPLDFRENIDYRPVGVAALQNGAIVLTEGKSYLIQGASPLSYSIFPQEPALPCVSMRSIVAIPEGVMYQSAMGIALATPGGVRLLTQDYWDDRAWRALGPGPMRAMFYAGQYIGLWETAAGTAGLMMEPGAAPSTLTLRADAAYLDEPTGLAYVVQGQDVGLWDASVTRLPYVWKSKRYVLEQPATFSVFRAEREIPATADLSALNAPIIAANQALIAARAANGGLADAAVAELSVAGDALQPLVGYSDAEAGEFRLYRNGVEVRVLEIADREPNRFAPPGLATDWQFSITGTLTLGRVALASNIRELRG